MYNTVIGYKAPFRKVFALQVKFWGKDDNQN